MNIDEAIFLIVGRSQQSTERKLVFTKNLVEQEGEFQKDKTHAKLPHQ
jgi:hypothetical protein